MRCGERVARRSASRAARPTGRFRKKIRRQSYRLNKPPITGPDDDATAAPRDHRPTARLRRDGSWWACPISANDAGIIAAAAAPWAKRATTSQPKPGASAQPRDAEREQAQADGHGGPCACSVAEGAALSRSAANISV